MLDLRGLYATGLRLRRRHAGISVLRPASRRRRVVRRGDRLRVPPAGCRSWPSAPSASSRGGPANAASVDLPGGAARIGLDARRFSKPLDRLVAAAGRTGTADLVDPTTMDVTGIGGFYPPPTF